MDTPHPGDRTRYPDVRIRLLGGFSLTVRGHRAVLPLSAQRVLVALALRTNEQDRVALGSMLYPDGRRSQVSASLRSALWRAKRVTGCELVASRGQRLHLSESVEVDVQRWAKRGRDLTSRACMDLTDCNEMVEALSQALLPTWGDEWLVLEQQRWDHLRLHALEWLVERLAAVGRYLDAVDAGLAAVAIEPYRESAHRALINAYIAEGNCASALAQYRRYQQLLTRELGVRPTSQLRELVQGITLE